jgi:hypothetical protein
MEKQEPISETTTVNEKDHDIAIKESYVKSGKDDDQAMMDMDDENPISDANVHDNDLDNDDTPIVIQPSENVLPEDIGQPSNNQRQGEETNKEQKQQERNESSSAVTSSTQASGLVQVGALLWKNSLTKLRTPVSTFFEFCSPLLMMLVLAAAYTLSEIVYRDAKTYTSISLDIPGPWLDIINPALDLFVDNQQQTQRNLFQFDEEYIDRHAFRHRTEGYDASFGESMSHKLIDRIKDISNSHRMLQTGDSGGNTTNNDPDQTNNDDNMEDFTQNYELLDNARQQVCLVVVIRRSSLSPPSMMCVYIPRYSFSRPSIHLLPSFLSMFRLQTSLKVL